MISATEHYFNDRRKLDSKVFGPVFSTVKKFMGEKMMRGDRN